MTFQEKLEKYANLLVGYCLNVQEGQTVNITAESIHRDLVILAAKAAYLRGAKHVNVDLFDPRSARIRILHSRPDYLTFVPGYVSTKYRDIMEQGGANLRIVGSEDPDVLSDLDPKSINTVRLHQHLAIKFFYDEGIGKSRVHWTVASAATPAWGQKVFPDLERDAACSRLWEQIFTLSRIGEGDTLSLWHEHDSRLRQRAERLTAMKIEELHFTGPGTDLHVFLSPKALFRGGAEVGPKGLMFQPNMPTEEVFTTPDANLTAGKVRTTRPFLINGKLIRGLCLEFKNGEIASFTAEEGGDAFREYINSDQGSKRLGEVALVGIDSPVFQSGLVFQEILLDENAACHVAVGSAYKFCVDSSSEMTPEELKSIGCNESTVHTDMMISSDEVDVTAKLFSGEEIVIIRKGSWEEF